MSERDSRHSVEQPDGVGMRTLPDAVVPLSSEVPNGAVIGRFRLAVKERNLRPLFKRAFESSGPALHGIPEQRPPMHEAITPPSTEGVTTREKREGEPILTDTQRAIADMTYSLRVFDALASDVKPRLPWLEDHQRLNARDGETLTPKELQTNDLRGMLEAYKAVMRDNPQDRKRFEENYADKGYHHTLEGRVRALLPQLEGEKARIDGEASQWTKDDEKKYVKAAHKYAVKVPKEQRELLQQESGISAELVKTKLEKWGITVGAFVASTSVIDYMAFMTGTAAVIVDKAAEHPIDNVNTAGMLALLAGTYLTWGAGMRKNIKQNWELLEHEGWSTNAPSKAMHDLAESKGYSEKWQKRLTGAGYVATEAVKELPWWVGAGLAEYTDLLSFKESLLFIAGANIGATLYEYGAAYGTEAYLRFKEKRATRRSQPKHRRPE